jgi:hypothetical protein
MHPLWAFLSAGLFTMAGDARASEAVLNDNKVGPPARCLQQLFGLRDPFGRIGTNAETGLRLPPLQAVTSARSEDDLARREALRAQRLMAGLPEAGRREIETAWDGVVSARESLARSLDRTCSSGQISAGFGIDLANVVLAPVEIIAAFSPDERNRPRLSRALRPVVGAVGLASDPVFAVALPFARLKNRFQARAASRALRRFSRLVADRERGEAGPAGP